MTGKILEHIVKSIMPGSIAEELGIEPGDKLLSIDGQEIEDIFDYQFYVEDEEIVLLIEKMTKEAVGRGNKNNEVLYGTIRSQGGQSVRRGSGDRRS